MEREDGGSAEDGDIELKGEIEGDTLLMNSRSRQSHAIYNKITEEGVWCDCNRR